MAINNVVLNGNLTKDIELKYSASGIAIARFTLAVQRSFSDGNGNRESDFIQCIAFKKTAETLANYVGKGSKIGVVGRILTGSYENNEGKRVYTTDVAVSEFEFLDKKNGNNQQQNSNQNYNRVSEDPFASNEGPIEISEGDLPF